MAMSMFSFHLGMYTGYQILKRSIHDSSLFKKGENAKPADQKIESKSFLNQKKH